MAGLSGAVEDGVRNTGVVIALLVSVALGWAHGSVIVGVGALVAGSLIATLWARHAGARFRERQMAAEDQEERGSRATPRES